MVRSLTSQRFALLISQKKELRENVSLGFEGCLVVLLSDRYDAIDNIVDVFRTFLEFL